MLDGRLEQFSVFASVAFVARRCGDCCCRAAPRQHGGVFARFVQGKDSTERRCPMNPRFLALQGVQVGRGVLGFLLGLGVLGVQVVQIHRGFHWVLDVQRVLEGLAVLSVPSVQQSDARRCLRGLVLPGGRGVLAVQRLLVLQGVLGFQLLQLLLLGLLGLRSGQEVLGVRWGLGGLGARVGT